MPALIMIFCLFVDMYTKGLAERHLSLNQDVPLIGNFLCLRHIKNRGAAFGFLHNADFGIYLLTGLSLIFSLYIVYLLFHAANRKFTYLAAFIAAGCLGNLIDRVRFGMVTDMISLNFGSYSFPCFNFADMCLSLSIVALVIMTLRDFTFLDNFLIKSHNKHRGGKKY